ncbi:MAG TPA: hypothetical protein VJL81_04900 [Solirubrobacterales bacterium]|nr:hypothetical protein [Solirubrobacterales bacterium]
MTEIDRTSITPDKAERPKPRSTFSRRGLLLGGVALGLTAVTARGIAAPLAFAAPRTHLPLALDYRPAQPTGWTANGRTSTVGGHRAFRDFVVEDKPYRISLLGFRDPTDRPDPVYEAEPTDREVEFKKTLGKGFGSKYAFRYLGGFEGRSELSVQSYSVFVDPPTTGSPEMQFGADLYLVYTPDPHNSDPPIDDRLQWIQVVRSAAQGMPTIRQVDNLWRANPFYLVGGDTSIDGRDVGSFFDAPESGGSGVDPTQSFLSELFLAQDTGRRDRAGRAIVNLSAGVKWGWQVERL